MSTRWTCLVVEPKTSLTGGSKPGVLQEELDRQGRAGREPVNVVRATPTASPPTLIFKKEA
jgi:hypothetical protein